MHTPQECVLKRGEIWIGQVDFICVTLHVSTLSGTAHAAANRRIGIFRERLRDGVSVRYAPKITTFTASEGLYKPNPRCFPISLSQSLAFYEGS